MTAIDESVLTVVPIHQHPEYLQECCDLVNEEWPRSQTARMLSLHASCDKMPTCLILLTGDKRVIGHCKLTPIPSIKESCFVESVVISKSLRGKGLGTFLMRAIEEYCRSILKLKTIHLSTKGQEPFYEKLGYEVCEPITIYGTFPQTQKSPHITQPKNKKTENQNSFKTAPPPPPPLPPSQKISDNLLSTKTSKTFMVKSILL